MAVNQTLIEKTFELHSLRHSTQIEFLDTGVALRPNSRVEISAAGFVRLSFAIDGWASDPDGLKVPGPNYKTNLVVGFPFGALVGNVGMSGARFMVGSQLNRNGLGEGRLYLAVIDNGHWQNNIGSFRVKLKVSDAYDVGDPQKSYLKGVFMRKKSLVSVCLCLLIMLVTSAIVCGQPVVHLSGLVGKTPAEIETILGKPNQAGAITKQKISLPVTIANIPDYFQVYKISNVKLGIWFYQNKPILFQSGFRESQKIIVNAGNNYRIIDRQTLEDAFSSIGIDIKNQKPDEVRFEEGPAAPAILPKTVVKIWKREFNGEKWERIECRENESPQFKVKFGRKLERFVFNVWIVPPITK